MAFEKLLILKKIPYQETSLIISGINPQLGKLDILIKGGKRLKKKAFPQADLFRVVDVDLKDAASSSMQAVFKLEMIHDYSALAKSPKCYLMACSIAAFVLKNSNIHIACPMIYRAVTNAFSQMAKVESKVNWEGYVKLIYLYENGLLPQDEFSVNSDENQRKKEFLHQAILFALGQGKAPTADNQYWDLFFQWIDNLCTYHDL